MTIKFRKSNLKLHFRKITSLFLLGFAMSTSIFAQKTYELPTLSFKYSALEPFIDSLTMQIHHSKHHQTYVTNLNNALKTTGDTNKYIESLLKNISAFPEAVKNNAGGHYNHSLFWTLLTPNHNTMPSKRLAEALTAQLGGLDSVKIKMNAQAAKRFGSGWVWLCVGPDKKLFITTTANQDNPLMDNAAIKGTPILAIDVWEHAYYLKYQNKRADYLTAIWNVINWEQVSKYYEAAVPKGKFDEWPEIKSFHKVMSQTFHPSEDGNLEPIKTRSAELLSNAELLSKSAIPAEFDNKEVRSAIKKLVTDSKKLDKLIKNKGKDEVIKKSLTELHDTFHLIVEKCSPTEAHH